MYLFAEWIFYMSCYRLYDPRYPEKTVAYVDTLDDAERDCYEILEV